MPEDIPPSHQPSDPEMPAAVNFRVGFNGPALEMGTMSVRDLAPALLALSDLIEEANRVVQKDNGPAVNLRFKAVDRGSFIVELSLSYGILEAIIDFFTSDAINALGGLMAFLGFGGGMGKGLMWLIKKIRGRKIVSVEVLEGDKLAQLKMKDGEIIEIETQVLELFRNHKIRENAYELLKPLKSEGVEEFYVGNEDEKYLEVKKDEVLYYLPPKDPEEELSDTERETFVSIDTLAFKEDNKWRVFDGSSSFFATILDAGFLAKVQGDAIEFKKSDVLHVRIRTRQTRTSEGLKQEHEIIEVIRHIKNSPQLSLPFTKSPDKEE